MKIYEIQKVKLSNFFLVILSCLFLFSCNVTKINEEGEELSKQELNATSAAEEAKRLETEVDTESLKANEKKLLSDPELKKLGSFSDKIIRTGMRSLQHTYWVMAEANEMKDYLDTAGVELIGDVIVPGDEKKAEFLDYGVIMSGGQAYVVTEMDKVIVAFRDTGSDKRWERILNMLTDARATLKKLSFLDDPELSKISAHEGFVSEYMLFREKVIEYVSEHPDKEIYIVGHSLGGALTTLASFDIASTLGREVNAITFGAPRVGMEEFRDAFEELPIKMYRFVVANDPIPRVPGMLIPYEHVGELIQIDESGDLYGLNDVNTALLFSTRDFTDHHKSSYYFGLVGLYTLCQNKDYEKCNDKDYTSKLAKSERESQEQFWEKIPLDKVNFPADKLPVDKIPVSKMLDLKNRLSDLAGKAKSLKPWEQIPWEDVPSDLDAVIPEEKIPWGN
ncbi:MAG: lipase family protein [Chloroflexota bacterium]|nr:lipase family protein [Chloroflexota bacterium]MQG04364.1 lipase family protein [SAR202 cluster bacterium]|tara:strand:- start:1895 stop:3244 length:1350 start_codon:yes stop_codon:yes gene_type:complete